MTDPIYLLDFRRGVVEKVIEPAPPLDFDAVTSTEAEVTSRGTGVVFAALGSPPEQNQE